MLERLAGTEVLQLEPLANLDLALLEGHPLGPLDRLVLRLRLNQPGHRREHDGRNLSGTVEDYAKFLQLFSNGGEFNGIRLLSPKTIEMMMTDQLPALPAEVGLAFGLETRNNDHESPRSLGSFSWGGAFNTTYWADPKEQLIGLIYTNLYNTEHGDLGARFTVLTQAALLK